MAQLKNRDAFEDIFQSRLHATFKRARVRYLQELGHKPDPRAVSESFWSETETDLNSELTAMLVVLFMFAAKQHGGDEGRMIGLARDFAQQRASEVSSLVMGGTRTRLDALEPKLVESMRAFIIKAKRSKALPQDDESDLLLYTALGLTGLSAAVLILARLGKGALAQRGIPDTFGPLASTGGTLTDELNIVLPTSPDPDKADRAERIAISETTTAATKGGTAAIEDTVGLSPGDIWVTMYDARVCPICRPLHGQRREVWYLKFPQQPLSVFDDVAAFGGPPAHHICRCWLAYANTPAGKLAISQVNQGLWPDEIERLRNREYPPKVGVPGETPNMRRAREHRQRRRRIATGKRQSSFAT